MELITAQELSSVIGQLNQLPLKSISITVSAAAAHSFNVAFQLSELKSQGRVKSYVMSCDEEGGLKIDVAFPDTAPVDPMQDQSSAPVEAVEV